MFERYTEKARRVVFFSRYEASQSGNREIGTHHLLLGLLREDPELAERVADTARIREEFVGLAGKSKLSTSVDLPLSHQAKRALAFAAEEAERARSRTIGTRHLLAGLLREDHPAKIALERRGITLELCRAELMRPDPGEKTIQLEALIDQLPADRLEALEQIIRALLRPTVTILVRTQDNESMYSFAPRADG